MKINVPKLVLGNFVMSILALSTMLGTALGGYLFIRDIVDNSFPREAALVELRSVPPAEPLCPGDKLEYIFGVQQLRSPIIARIVRTVVSLNEERTVLPGRNGDVELRIWRRLDGFEQAESYDLPMVDKWGQPLKPGSYELRVGVVTEGSAPSVVSLAFRIRPCP